MWRKVISAQLVRMQKLRSWNVSLSACRAQICVQVCLNLQELDGPAQFLPSCWAQLKPPPTQNFALLAKFGGLVLETTKAIQRSTKSHPIPQNVLATSTPATHQTINPTAQKHTPTWTHQPRPGKNSLSQAQPNRILTGFSPYSSTRASNAAHLSPSPNLPTHISALMKEAHLLPTKILNCTSLLKFLPQLFQYSYANSFPSTSPMLHNSAQIPTTMGILQCRSAEATDWETLELLSHSSNFKNVQQTK